MRKITSIALAFSFCFSSYAIARNGETRTARFTTSVSLTDEINIQGKHTELIIEKWDKNEVAIEATIRYDGETTDKIEDFLNGFEKKVEDHIVKSSGKLTVNTDLDFPYYAVKSSFFGLTKEIHILGKTKLTYKIKAPGNNPYTITNSYEDVKLIGSFKDVDFIQHSGKLEAENIEITKMNLKYGSATIKSVGSADMELYEQDIEIDVVEKMVLNSKYSDLKFLEAGPIEVTAYESDFVFNSVKSLSGNFKYGEIEINQKIDEGEFQFYEMDMKLKVGDKLRFTNCKYSKLFADKVDEIVFDESYEDDTEIDYLGTFKSLNSKYGKHNIGSLTKSLSLKAYEDELDIQSMQSSISEIEIDGKYLDISIDTEDASYIFRSDVKYGKVDYTETLVDVKRYVKDSNQLEVEIHSKKKSENPTRISVKGYEVDVNLED